MKISLSSDHYIMTLPESREAFLLHRQGGGPKIIGLLGYGRGRDRGQLTLERFPPSVTEVEVEPIEERREKIGEYGFTVAKILREFPQMLSDLVKLENEPEKRASRRAIPQKSNRWRQPA